MKLIPPLAVPYLLAFALYEAVCPPRIKGIRSEWQWTELAQAEKQKIVNAMTAERGLAKQVDSHFDEKLGEYFQTMELSTHFDEKQLSVLRAAMKARVGDTFNPPGKYTAELAKYHHSEFEKLEAELPYWRLLIGALIALTMAASGLEIFEKAWLVAKASFHHW